MSATLFRQLSRRSRSITTTTTYLRTFTTSPTLCKKDRSPYIRVNKPVDPDYEDYTDVHTVSRRNNEFLDRMALLVPAGGDAYPLMKTDRERDGQNMRHVEFRNKYGGDVLAPGERRTEEKVTIRGVFLCAVSIVVAIVNKIRSLHIELR
jgi:hypothetical protein